MTDDERLDLSALDPTEPPAEFERRVRAVLAAAAPALRLRRLGLAGGALGLVARWRVPLLAAAAIVILISAAMYAVSAPVTEELAFEDGSEAGDVLEALGVPAELDPSAGSIELVPGVPEP